MTLYYFIKQPFLKNSKKYENMHHFGVLKKTVVQKKDC